MTAPNAPCSPARLSPRLMLARTGALSGYPFRCRIPPYACHPACTFSSRPMHEKAGVAQSQSYAT